MQQNSVNFCIETLLFFQHEFQIAFSGPKDDFNILWATLVEHPVLLDKVNIKAALSLEVHQHC